jgi:hypothetical protein
MVVAHFGRHFAFQNAWTLFSLWYLLGTMGNWKNNKIIFIYIFKILNIYYYYYYYYYFGGLIMLHPQNVICLRVGLAWLNQPMKNPFFNFWNNAIPISIQMCTTKFQMKHQGKCSNPTHLPWALMSHCGMWEKLH